MGRWIEHLCSCACGYQQSTHLLGLKENFIFNPVSREQAMGLAGAISLLLPEGTERTSALVPSNRL